MALIKCKECGKQISDKASCCPSCGSPVATEKQKDEPYTKALFIIFGIILLLFGLFHLFSGTNKLINNNTNTNTDYNTYNNDDTYIIEIHKQ